MKNVKQYSIVFAIFLVIILAAGGWWFLSNLAEGEKPHIKMASDFNTIGLEKVINISFEDRKTGLRNLSVSIIQDNKSHVLASQTFSDKGIRQKSLSLTVLPLSLKLHDGSAMLTVSAIDFSLRKNETIVRRPVAIDITPPQIFLLTSQNNINPGGSCLVIYNASEPAVMSGVTVDDHFSPGYPLTVSNKTVYVAFFGLPRNAGGNKTGIRIIARDNGGNETSVGLPALIRHKRFRHDTMKLSDNFLNRKMPDFLSSSPELSNITPLEIFAYVNGQMRIQNENRIREMSLKSAPKQLWEGTFLRMKNASPMALFGDQRTYLYENKLVGESEHLGVDLASLSNSPVEAANNGIVTFADNLGIYGNMVMIDHGLGIASIYSHLSVINVQPGQQVKKGDVIGNTGITGLAAGDHLHFGMLAGGKFVNPIEWWDSHWITDNITKKLVSIK